MHTTKVETMINKQAIATHLKVEVSRIKSVDIWANCLFVVVAGVGARFVSKKVIKMDKKLHEQIEDLTKPSERETEILKSGARDFTDREYLLTKEQRLELRNIREERKNKKFALLKDGWEKLKEMGYEQVKDVVNPAYASGHSDYDDPADRRVMLGILCPDGEFIDAGGIWSNSILPAMKKAGI